MKVKGKRILKNGAVAGYVYYSKEKKWKWRIIGRDKKGGGGNAQSKMITFYRNSLFTKEKLSLNTYIHKFDDLHDLFDTIIEHNRLLLFKDYHGKLEKIYYVLINLQYLMTHHNFNVLFIEMLPYDFEIQHKLNDINEPIKNKINSITTFFKDRWSHKSDFEDLKSNTMYQCLVIYAIYFGYKIYGCDDTSTYSKLIFDRYSMNAEISKRINSVLSDEKNKGIGFFGSEHLNMRSGDYSGIPYYLSSLYRFNQFLVIDILNKKNPPYGLLKKFTDVNVNEDNFNLIKTTPEVDFPHYFIIMNIPLDILKIKIQAVCVGINKTISKS